SIAHALMLYKNKLLTQHEAKAILEGLKKILGQHKAGSFTLVRELEDVHMNVEAQLTKLTPHGKKVHTARSRNDQVNLDMRLYMRAQIIELLEKLAGLGKALAIVSAKKIPMAAYTHTRVAMPISVSYWANAYFDSFARDALRLSNAYDMLNTNPLGSGAVAGTSLPIDREYTAKLLGFESVQENSLDCSSSRGEFEAEVAFGCCLVLLHLSRICEELVWQSQKGLVSLPDQYCTGSSMMPQKKNADILELVRGRAGRAYGNLLHILVSLKGLPSGYNSDTQETKFAIMSSLQTAKQSVEVLARVLPDLEFDKAKLVEEIEQGYACATELSDVLVSAGVPFRDAHSKVGQIVKQCISSKTYLSALKPERIEQMAEVLVDKGELAQAVNPDKTNQYDAKIAASRIVWLEGLAGKKSEKLAQASKLLYAELEAALAFD
ncbi:argininosuccinate lyase, partial [Candidatus Parvarchaeota archaeon]|nr:argininosuccinate lyase [Candidatus Parvarchaeota archaeon]